ncbi:glycosyltransferase [Saxibacter everestensis]|uniref:Glycosyltransferase n=1 Tax=Saxibacter everestensis TaxID=2909229 RepID=A0ABY8QTX5_9MICO|nr:glycosyltransferase [Brevibacteriaceae bacterium ZFBP1038]
MKNLAMTLVAIVYGTSAFLLFCASGVFGRFGRDGWRDVALVTVTLTASIALTYISLLIITYLRRRRNSPGDSDDFDWHLLVPCRDEENVIAATVSAARTSFPRAHVWVIDDASQDSTARVVKELMDFDVRVHLISRVRPDARVGKGEALNAAYSVVSDYVGTDQAARRRAVVGVLDADGYLSDNALSFLSGPETFGSESVGAAQLEVWMKNRNDVRPVPHLGRWANLLGRYLIRMQDVEFRTTNSAMQLLRTKTGTVGMGGNGQFTRLTVLDDLAERHGKPWGRKLSEDYELGLYILELGYTNHYVPEAHVSQEALPYFGRLLTQRTRWAQGIMECASILPRLRRSGQLSLAGHLEVNYFMSQPWLMMLNLILVPILLWTAIQENRFGFVDSASALVTVLAAMVYLILPYAVWGPIYRKVANKRMGILAATMTGLGTLVYVYLTYVYYPRAIMRLVTGENSWAKTMRNADGIAPVIVTPIHELALPLVNREELEALAGELDQRNDLALEFVSAFAIMWPTRLARLKEALAAEDIMSSRDAAGSIQVSAAMIGAERLELFGGRVAALARGGDFAACRQELPFLQLTGESTVRVLRNDYLDDLKRPV